MKKLLATGLCAAMACTMLAGCGSKDKAKDKEYDLYVAGLDGGYGTEAWKAVIKSFEEKEGVKVKAEFDKTIADKLSPVLKSGKNVPDLIYLSIGAEGHLTDTLVSEKQLVEITDILDMEVDGVKLSEKILPGFADGATTRPYGDGKMYLAPLFMGPCGLYFNQTLLEENGWEVPQTWDDMWKLGDAAKEKGIALFTYPTTGYFDAFFSSLLNATAGPDVYAKLMNWDVDAWKLPEVKKAFEIVGKLATYTEKNTVANANGEGFTKNQQLILDGKAIFCPNGSWLPGEMGEAPRTENFKWGVMAIPAVEEGGKKYFTNFQEQMYIPKAAKNVDLAKKFMAYCYSDEATELFYNTKKTIEVEEDGKKVKKEVETKAVQPTEKGKELVPEADRYQYDVDGNANAVGFRFVEKVEGVDVNSADGLLYGTVNSIVTGDKTVDQWYDSVVEGVTKVAEASK